MRIAHYMSGFQLEAGGVCRAVLDICAELARRGLELQIITCDATDIPESWKRGDAGCPSVVQVVSPSRLGGFFDRHVLGQLEELIQQADILHLHTPWDRSNLQLAKLARKHHVPYVLTVHGMLDDWSMSQRGLKKRIYLALGARRMLEQAAVVHCTAQGELDQAKKWFPRGHGESVPLIFDLSPFTDLPGAELARQEIEAAATDLPTLLFLSRVHYKKRPEALIDATAVLKQRGRDVRTLIAGTGDDAYVEALKERVRERDVEDRVFFLGLVLGDVKVSLFEGSDIFVLPTSQENFGYVLTESLACATPVVTTKGTDIWPELEQSGGAVIVPGEAEPIADAVEALLDDPVRRADMGRKGRDWVFQALDPDTITEQFKAMYRGAIERTRTH